MSVSRRQANDFFAVFFSIFDLGGITKHLINNWFSWETVSFVSPQPQCPCSRFLSGEISVPN